MLMDGWIFMSVTPGMLREAERKTNCLSIMAISLSRKNRKNIILITKAIPRTLHSLIMTRMAISIVTFSTTVFAIQVKLNCIEKCAKSPRQVAIDLCEMTVIFSLM